MKLGYFLLVSKSYAESGENTDGITNSETVENETVGENFKNLESTWSEWDECSKKCGGGVRTRIMEPCEDQCELEEENCNELDCNWSEWIQGECSKTCGSGIAVRKRECPEEHQCIGSAVESIKCGSKCENEITNTWGEWSEWSQCTKTCATNGKGGSKTRKRACDGTCDDGKSQNVWACNQKKPCPQPNAHGQHGKWTNWGNWSACTGSCQKAVKDRWRNCQSGWNKCDGQNKETVSCQMHNCTGNNSNDPNNNWESQFGSWANWTNWSSCSKTCGAGFIYRSRTCNRKQKGCKNKFGREMNKEDEKKWCKKVDCSVTWQKPSPTTWQKLKPVANMSAKPKVTVTGNLFKNGNCEGNAGTWGTTTNWFCNNCVASRFTSDKHEGSSSMKISGRKATWAGINYNLGNQISDGGSYHLIGWIKILSPGSHKVAITAKIEGSGKPDYRQQLSKVVSGNTWTELNGVVSATGGAVTLYTEGFGKADYLIDQFSLVKMDGGDDGADSGNNAFVAEKSHVKTPIPKHDDGKEKLKDPGFEISPNWGIGWGCQGCVGVPVTDDVKSGKRAMKITQRQDTWAGPVQSLKYGAHIMKNVVYTAQIWVKSLGDDSDMDTYELTVKVDYRTKKDQWLKFGKLCTTPGQWGLLSGQVQIKDDPHLVNQLEFYVEGPKKSRNYLVDGASLKVSKVPESFYEKANSEIDRLRKVDLTVEAAYPEFSNVTISISQVKHNFPFGSAIDAPLFSSNSAYRKFFYDNFNYAVFENRMKWRQIEWSRGNRNFNEVDRVVDMLQNKNIPIRGHTVFWGVDQYVPKWLKSMQSNQQRQTCRAHADDIVGRFKGKMTHWDVNNEMLHGNYFEKTLGGSIRSDMFKWTKEADPNALTFVNDYEVLSGGLTNCYKEQIKGLMKEGAPIDGIGVQSHFKDAERNVDPIQVQSKLDSLAELGLPIWVTELDIAQWDAKSRAKHLSFFLRAAFSHESVEGIILWGYWDQRHWKGKEASLADGPALTLNAAGQKYRDLVFREWWTQIKENSSSVNTRAFKGDYVIKALDENGNLIETKTISLLENSRICLGDCSNMPEVELKSASNSPQDNDEGSGEVEEEEIDVKMN